MYHSVTFGTKNTWDDWHLIPTTRPVFNPPELKSNYVEIPGMNGTLDLTEALTGRPTYNNREGSMEFVVVNDYLPWDVAYSNIMTYLHGKRIQATLEDDRYFYYEGRFTVNEWKSDKNYSLITIDYNVHPYKKEINDSSDLWLWDPFDFYEGVIRNYVDLKVDGSLTVNLTGTQEPVIPGFYVKADSGSSISVEYNGVSYPLENSKSLTDLKYVSQIYIQESDISIKLKGNGTVTISYRGGRL